MICLWCGEPLTFERGKGWMHPDGKVLKSYIGRDGLERDDHCSRPVPDGTPPPKLPRDWVAWRRQRYSSQDEGKEGSDEARHTATQPH